MIASELASETKRTSNSIRLGFLGNSNTEIYVVGMARTRVRVQEYERLTPKHIKFTFIQIYNNIINSKATVSVCLN